MGVHLKLAAISEVNVGQLLENPRLIWKVIFPSDANSGHHWANNKKHLLPEQFPMEFSLAEYWHVMHYLLSGKIWSGKMPEAFLLDGGSFIGTVDVGYGPARVFDPTETQIIANMLEHKKVEDLIANFDPLQLTDVDIYPQIWDTTPNARSKCMEYFKQLQYFMRHAAENQRGLVVYLIKENTDNCAA